MKVVFVVDSIANLKEKIETVKQNFTNDILYVVKSPFVNFVKSYDLVVNAVYSTQIARVVHRLLEHVQPTDIIMYYSSLTLKNSLINQFKNKIGAKDKVVNVLPNYNIFERAYNGIYNGYVKMVFKNKDSMASPKLQFLPEPCVAQLLSSHFANKLFEISPELVRTVRVEDTSTSKMLKQKYKFNKFSLIPIIVALVITLAWVILFAFVKPHYLLVLLFIVLYVIDFILGFIFHFKTHFDNRFLN